MKLFEDKLGTTRKRRQLSIYLPDDLRTWIESQADLYECSLSDVVIRSLEIAKECVQQSESNEE